MSCLKCGREVAEGQVFCDSCRQVMDQNPVKPGTPVLLPPPKLQSAAKKPSHRKRAMPPEEQVIQLKKALRRMELCAAVLIIVLGMATYLLVREIQKDDAPVIGQNYTIDTTLQTD